MTSNASSAAYAVTLLGVVAVAALAVLFSSRVAGVAAGVILLALAGLRATKKLGGVIGARSTPFDAVFLVILGAGVIILALTADNI